MPGNQRARGFLPRIDLHNKTKAVNLDIIEKATVMHYHRHRITEFQQGTVEALGWCGTQDQLARYKVLVNVGDLNGASILDIGCGYGDLKAFLDQYFSDFDYIGIDQMPEFIAEAKARHGHCSRTTFCQTDFCTAELPHVDYVFASGALCYRCKNERFYSDMICKLYNSAKVAFAFNMLDGKNFPQHDLLIGHECDEILAFCRALSPQVECFSDYSEDDFTVFMVRDSIDG
jgi:SAM-dependent methyltransferase